MNELHKYLTALCSSVFKILPMKENELNGVKNNLKQYVESLIINMKGGLQTFPKLVEQKEYLFTINNLQFLVSNDIEFKQFRKIILTAVSNISELSKIFEPSIDGEEYGTNE